MKKEGSLVKTILRPALGLWLRSQVESIQRLEIAIDGSDRQVFSGQVPRLAVEAEGVVYQGVHLKRLHLVSHDIRMNLGQVLRGQPLRLLQSIDVKATAVADEAGLNASLQSPLLLPLLEAELEAIASWLSGEEAPHSGATAAQAAAPTAQRLTHLRLGLEASQLRLQADWIQAKEQHTISIQAGVSAERDSLSLTQLQWRQPPPGLQKDLSHLPHTSIQLGEVMLESFTILPGELRAQGQLTVYP